MKPIKLVGSVLISVLPFAACACPCRIALLKRQGQAESTFVVPAISPSQDEEEFQPASIPGVGNTFLPVSLEPSEVGI